MRDTNRLSPLLSLEVEPGGQVSASMVSFPPTLRSRVLSILWTYPSTSPFSSPALVTLMELEEGKGKEKERG